METIVLAFFIITVLLFAFTVFSIAFYIDIIRTTNKILEQIEERNTTGIKILENMTSDKNN